MNIIHVPRRFTRDSWGGTETVVLETSKHQRRAGHDVRIVTTQALCGTAAEVIEGVPVSRTPHFYPYLGLSSGAREQLDRRAGNLFSFAMLRELHAAPNVDLFHLHTGKRLGGIVRTAARRRNVPYVVSLHGGVYDVPAQEAQSWTEPTQGAFEWGRALGWAVGSRRVLDDAAAILCLSAEEQQQVQAQHPGRRVELIPNGVDTARFRAGHGARFRAEHGIPADRQMVLTVGRIDPQKNQRLAVRAAARLRADGLDVHLVLIGPVTHDAYAAALRQEISERGLADRVSLVEGLEPGSPTLVDAYHAADVFLLPSLHEPFGIVLLEAWAAGCPVVAARVGGVPGFVRNGTDGLLFDTDDTPDAVRALAGVLVNQPFARKLGQAGRVKAGKTYDWSAVTARVEGIYEEVVHAHSVR